MLMPIDLIFTILSYNKNVNLLINKEYYKKIKIIKKTFLIKPLFLEYRLIEYKKKRDNDIYPKINVRKKQNTTLNGRIPMGEIDKNQYITASQKLYEKLVPKNKKFLYPYFLWNYYSTPHIIIEYDLYYIRAIDYKRAIFYNQLFS
jgi:hypothetical protein